MSYPRTRAEPQTSAVPTSCRVAYPRIFHRAIISVEGAYEWTGYVLALIREHVHGPGTRV